MPEPSEVERDVEAVSDCLTDLRLLVESVTPDTQALKRARWADRQGHEFLAALEARLKEVEGERDDYRKAAFGMSADLTRLGEDAERVEAQLRVTREGLTKISEFESRFGPSDEALSARETLARLDAPEQAASGHCGEN